MTRDYASRNKQSLKSYPTKNRIKKNSFPDKTPRIHAWRWIMFGLILGVGLAMLLFIKIQPLFNQSAPQINHSSEALLQGKKSTSQPTTPHAPRFDFYTLLPSMESEISQSNFEEKPKKPSEVKEISKLTTKTAPNQPQVPIARKLYMIQAGAFRSLQQAETLKIELLLQGFDAHVHTIQSPEKSNLFKVTIGPFQTEAQAKDEQLRLESNNQCHSLIIKEKT